MAHPTAAHDLWRFDVPRVPPAVTSFKDEMDRVWLRLPNDEWALSTWDPEYIRRCEERTTEGGKVAYPLIDLLDGAPLVECEDPRGAS